MPLRWLLLGWLQAQHLAQMNLNSSFAQIGKGARRIDPVPQLPVYRRHLLIDHHRKVIYIEVMASRITQNLNSKEFHDIKNGDWQQYVPKDHVKPFQDCIASGYLMEAVYIIGMENEDFRVMQITNLVEGKKDIFNKR